MAPAIEDLTLVSLTLHWQAAEKKPYASLPLNRLAPTYCKYARARRFSRASHLDLFEQPGKSFFSTPVSTYFVLPRLT